MREGETPIQFLSWAAPSVWNGVWRTRELRMACHISLGQSIQALAVFWRRK